MDSHRRRYYRPKFYHSRIAGYHKGVSNLKCYSSGETKTIRHVATKGRGM